MKNRTPNEEQTLKQPQAMFLQSASISSFRSCRSTEVQFHPDLTLLVGENNAGKSNIVDAIRLATEPLSGRRTRYFDDVDVSRGSESEESTVSLRFRGCTNFQKAFFISGLDPQTGDVYYSAKYQKSSDAIPRSRVNRLAGKFAGPDSEPEARNRIKHVYLEPLRDAQRELDSAGGRRLGAILKFLLTTEQQKDFEQVAKDGLANLTKKDPIVDVQSKIQDHLSALTDAIMGQKIALGFESPEIDRLARGLRLKMGEADIDPVDLASSGLGYANLLFMATILLELQAAKDAELTILIVEEPEAHLHPQLQAVLLDFLQEQAAQSISNLSNDRPAGRIQVIATTHSPTLASSVSLDNIVVVRSVPESNQRKTVAMSLAAVKFSDKSNGKKEKDHDHGKRKIEQYLDVTRSALLFSRRVILVEGISEAVILPALAKYCVFKNPENREREYRQFRAATLINLGSVDFEPYLRLLLHDFADGLHLVEKLLVLTDEDPDKTNGDSKDESSTDAYNRKSEIIETFKKAESAGVLTVVESPYTLEVSLLEGKGNADFLKSVYVKQHPNSGGKWDQVSACSRPLEEMHRLMNIRPNDPSGDKNLDLRKGQFAHDFSLALERESKEKTGKFRHLFVQST